MEHTNRLYNDFILYVSASLSALYSFMSTIFLMDLVYDSILQKSF